jgi:hypothetical protein
MIAGFGADPHRVDDLAERPCGGCSRAYLVNRDPSTRAERGQIEKQLLPLHPAVGETAPH